MQRLQPGVDPELVALQQAEFWVQIHSLPVGFRSEMVVSAIGSFFGYTDAHRREELGWVYVIVL